MLYESVDAALAEGCLVSKEEFHPLPDINERDIWKHTDPETRAYFSGLSAALLNYVPGILPASLYADFYISGTRVTFERQYFERRRNLYAMCMAECIEDRGRYIGKICDLIWAICEETTWVIPAHMHQVEEGGFKDQPLPTPETAKAYIDLFCAETASVLAWAKYLLLPRLSAYPAITGRIDHEIKKRVLDVYLSHPQMGWTGLNGDRKLNNWTPWIYSNLLAVMLLSVGEADVRAQFARLIARGTDSFIAQYAPDGDCDEGPSYYNRAGASLLDELELFDYATGGRADIYSQPIIKNMSSYIMYAHIYGEYYINFADAMPRVRPDAMLVRRAAVRTGDEALKRWAENLLSDENCEFPCAVQYDGIYRRIKNTVTYRRSDLISSVRDYPLSHYFPGIQVACAREKADGSGLYVAAKGGTNAESHNHNDIGSYIVYLDGEPYICDAGTETYRRETFSSGRYNIWTTRSCYHNTAIIGENDQLPGKEFAAKDVAFVDDGERAAFSLDMADAYGVFSHLDSYKRSVTLDRQNSEIVIEDEAALSDDIAVTLPLLCACEARLAPGEVQLRGKAGLLRISYDSAALSVKSEDIPLNDPSLRTSWQRDRLFRLLFTSAPKSRHRIKLRIHV